MAKEIKRPRGAPKGSRNKAGKVKPRPHGAVRQAKYYLSENLLIALDTLQENDHPEMTMSELVEMLIRTNPKAHGYGIGEN